MLVDMSLVTMLCSSTAAVEAMNSFTLPIDALMAASEPTTSPATAFSVSISLEIVSVACLAWLARFLTSAATTAKPLPAGELDHLERLAGLVEDRIVGGENPDFLAALAEPLVFGCLELAAIEPGPELTIGRAVAIGRREEHAVMLALDIATNNPLR